MTRRQDPVLSASEPIVSDLAAQTGCNVTQMGIYGFDEPTNFVKFFRREARCSPGDFRPRNSGR